MNTTEKEIGRQDEQDRGKNDGGNVEKKPFSGDDSWIFPFGFKPPNRFRAPKITDCYSQAFVVASREWENWTIFPTFLCSWPGNREN